MLHRSQQLSRRLEHNRKEDSKQIKENSKKKLSISIDRKHKLLTLKPRGYSYWKNIVKKNHIPREDQWKIIEHKIMMMRQQKEVRKRFRLIKLSELTHT